MQPLVLRRTLWMVAGVGVVGSACTSILGDFNSGAGQGQDASTERGPNDSGAEATGMGDSASSPADWAALDGAVDAPGDAADSGLLACTTWKWSQPLVLESLQG